MMRARLLALVLVSLLAGCDIAVGVYFATRKKSSNDSASVSLPDTTFSIWVANLSAGASTDAQVQNAIILNGGQPTAEWTPVGAFTRTTEVDLSTVPGTWDAILISATANQKYLLDAVVVLNASKDPLASFTAPNFSDRMIFTVPTAAENLPDGVTAETDATATQKAFIFKRYSGPLVPLSRFRVEIWDQTIGPTSGDTAWRRTVASPGEERSGGMGVFVSSPVDKLYVSYRNVVNATEDNIEIHELGQDGATTQNVPMETTVTGKVGAPSLAVMTNGDVVVAHSVGADDLRIKRMPGTLIGQVWSTAIANNGGTAARLEPNSLALDGSNNAILAGGLDFGGVIGFGHFMQRYAVADGADWVTTPAPPADVANSYWRGVATSGADAIYAVGDLTVTLPSVSLDMLARRTSQSSSGATETWGTTSNGAANGADCGNAIGVGSGATPPVYVGGFRAVTGQGRNAILHKLASDTGAEVVAASWPFSFNGSAGNGDDEILSLVVEGTLVYATGYETTAAQGRNLFVMKIDVSGDPLVLWKRTFHAGVGDDRGVSIKTTPTHVFVSGDVQVGAGDFDVFVWKLLK